MTTCTGGCGYWDVSYYFKQDAYILLKALKRMNIKNTKSLKVSQELDLGGPDGTGGPYFAVDDMSNSKDGDMYRKTEFGRIMSKTSQSTMRCTVNI